MDSKLDGATKIWYLIERMVTKCNLLALGSIDDFFEREKILKVLEDIIIHERQCILIFSTVTT
jgi:hypothetical protein